MSVQNELTKSLTAATALSAYTRAGVDSSGQATAAGATNLAIGVIQNDVALGDVATIRLYHPTCLVKAAGAITTGSQVYAAASGQITGSAAGNEIGVALESATASGDIIEIAETLN